MDAEVSTHTFLTGRLSLMRTVQLMKKMSDASKQKPGPKRKLSDSARKRNKREANAKLNNNHCQECVRAYLSIHDCYWTVRMSDNLPERVQILSHVHIICPGRQNYLLSNILRFALKICFWADFQKILLLQYQFALIKALCWFCCQESDFIFFFFVIHDTN
jgi:hypothetical protein